VKPGDLVRWNDDIVSSKEVGVIVCFDEDNDPVVLWQRSGDVECQYRYHVEVLDESRLSCLLFWAILWEDRKECCGYSIEDRS